MLKDLEISQHISLLEVVITYKDWTLITFLWFYHKLINFDTSLDRFYIFYFFFLLIFGGSCKTHKNLNFYLNIKIELMKCHFVIFLTSCMFRGHLVAFGAFLTLSPNLNIFKIISVNSYCGKTVRARKKLCSTKILQNYLSYLLE